jgi:peroxiredoxin
MEQLFGTLTPEIQSSPIGKYVAQQIEEGKRNPMGKTLADFQQEDPDGKMVSLSSFRGKYVLVDFWASWCGPCRQENPNVVNAFNKYKNKNFTVLGISLDKTKQPWLDAIAKDGLNWTQLSDLKGWSNAVAQQFQIQSIPQNFLIDPNGVVIGKNLRGEALESKLESLLNK